MNLYHNTKYTCSFSVEKMRTKLWCKQIAGGSRQHSWTMYETDSDCILWTNTLSHVTVKYSNSYIYTSVRGFWCYMSYVLMFYPKRLTAIYSNVHVWEPTETRWKHEKSTQKGPWFEPRIFLLWGTPTRCHLLRLNVIIQLKTEDVNIQTCRKLIRQVQ